MLHLWQINRQYVHKVRSHLDNTSGVTGEILVYGHLNPYGIDPHNRVTFACDDELIFAQACKQADALRDNFYREIAALCEQTDSILIGGEKGAASEREIYHAVGGPQNCPTHLQQKYAAQCGVIANAADVFSWRALPPFNNQPKTS